MRSLQTGWQTGQFQTPQKVHLPETLPGRSPDIDTRPQGQFMPACCLYHLEDVGKAIDRIGWELDPYSELMTMDDLDTGQMHL